MPVRAEKSQHIYRTRKLYALFKRTLLMVSLILEFKTVPVTTIPDIRSDV
jgi:hypothetical protein